MLAGPKESQRDLSEVAKTLSVDDIAKFLRQIKLEKYVQMFVENDVDGKMLLTLNQEDLKFIGIVNTFHHKKIIGQFQSYLEANY